MQILGLQLRTLQVFLDLTLGQNNFGKGQLISKANCQGMNSSKKQTNEFVFTSMRRVFIPFLEEFEDSKKAFRNYLTFNKIPFLLNFQPGKFKPLDLLASLSAIWSNPIENTLTIFLSWQQLYLV